MRSILFLSVSCSAVAYFSTLSYKRHDFRKNVNEHKICVCFSIRILSEIFLIRRIIQRDIFINVKKFLCKVHIIFYQFLMKLLFSQQIFKIYSNFMEIRLVGDELFHANRLTNGETRRHDKANSRFSLFWECAYECLFNKWNVRSRFGFTRHRLGTSRLLL